MLFFTVDYLNKKTFACLTCIHVNKGKLELRVRKIFMGYDNDVNGYRVWCSKTIRIITSRDDVFDESSMLGPPLNISMTNNVVQHIMLVRRSSLQEF